MFKGVAAPDGPKHPTRHQDVYGQMQMKPCKMITGAENLVLCGASVTEKNPKKTIEIGQIALDIGRRAEEERLIKR